MLALWKAEGDLGPGFLDPACGVHLLEEAKGALQQCLVFLRVVAAAEAAVGQQRLRQLGRGLDAFEHLQAPAESGVSLGPIAHSLVNLAENAVGRALLETEPILLSKPQRHVGRT